MKKYFSTNSFICAIAYIMAVYSSAYAQSPSQGRVVSSCGTAGITYMAGAFGPITVDTNGNLCFNGSGGEASSVNITASSLSTAASTAATVTSLGNSLVAKGSAGNLLGFYCTAITGGAAGYCVAYNATTAPSPGALTGALVLDVCAFDTGSKGCSLSRIPGPPRNYSTGITILVTSSSTPFTYTTGVDTAYISADVQ
jgi:hypothetical protein